MQPGIDAAAFRRLTSNLSKRWITFLANALSVQSNMHIRNGATLLKVKVEIVENNFCNNANARVYGCGHKARPIFQREIN
jgi:hypothetical protein